MTTEITGNERCIKLTHADIDLLVNSLKIAANVYYEQFELMSKRFRQDDGKEHKMYWYNKSCKITDLANSIESGGKDL